jgi:hypothetical protein
MSNKQRNIEAVFIHRPIATGQVRGSRNVRPDVEAAVCGIVYALFGENLLPPCNPTAMWHRKQAA